MDDYMGYIFLGLFLLLLFSLVYHMQRSKKKNALDIYLSELDQSKYLVIQSARIGMDERVKVFVDALVISSKGFFIVLKSDLRGQIHLNQEDEMISQVIVRQSYLVKNPIDHVLKLKVLFHKHMNIDCNYIKPIVVFDQQAELRYDAECIIPTIKVQELKSYIDEQPDGVMPEHIVALIKEQFN